MREREEVESGVDEKKVGKQELREVIQKIQGKMLVEEMEDS